MEDRLQLLLQQHGAAVWATRSATVGTPRTLIPAHDPSVSPPPAPDREVAPRRHPVPHLVEVVLSSASNCSMRTRPRPARRSLARTFSHASRPGASKYQTTSPSVWSVPRLLPSRAGRRPTWPARPLGSGPITGPSPLIPVGTALAGGPPDRSRRAELAHRAPALGPGGEAHAGVGMHDAGRGQPPVIDPAVTRPGHAMALASTPQRLPP